MRSTWILYDCSDMRMTRLFKLHCGSNNSDFGHVRTYSWLHKLRNTQGKIYGTYLRNIDGIYKGYIRSIHKYLWHEIIRNTGAAFGGRPIGSVFLIIIYHTCLWILYVPYIFHIYFLNMLHIFSHVCFLTYSVNSGSGHDQMTTFGKICRFRIQNLVFEVIS